MKPLRLRLLRLLGIAAAALPLLVAAGFEASAHTTPCVASVEEARRHMDQGLNFFEKKRYIEAAAEFDAAYQAQPYSAFLVNAAMAYQEALDYPNAIARYRAFLASEPNPPDLPRIKRMLAWLEAQRAAREAVSGVVDAGAPIDAGAPADAGAGDASAAVTDAGTPASDAGAAVAPTATPDAGPPEPPPTTAEMARSIRSQVVIESDPPGAPLTIFARGPSAAPYRAGAENPGWEKVAVGVKTPYDIALAVGDYHIVLEPFQDYKRSETDLSLSPGRVYTFKANLSQGKFLGFLRVTSPSEGAAIYIDDPPPHKKGPWGRAPHAAMLDAGEHTVWIEASGYEPFTQKITVERGKSLELTAVLQRLAYGYLVVDGNADEMEVKVDGVVKGTYAAVGDPLRIKLPAGAHRVELDASGRKAYAGIVEIPRGQEVAVHGRLSFTPPRLNALISGTLAIGAAAGGVVMLRQPSYTVTGVDAQGRVTYDQLSTQPWFKIGGGIAIGVAGLLTAATVFTLVHDPNPESRVKIDKATEFETGGSKKTCFKIDDFAPMVGSNGGGFAIRGSF